MSDNWAQPTNAAPGGFPPPPPPPPGFAQVAPMQIAPPTSVPASHAMYAPSATAYVADPQLPEYVVPAAAKRGRGKLVGAIAAGVVLLGGVGTAVALNAASDSGAATPEAAVQAMMDSVEAGDWLGAMETLPEGERQFYVKVAEKSLSEAKRMGFVSDTGSIRKVSGLKIDFQNITMTSTPVSKTIARVSVTGGSVVTDVKASELPIGDVLNKLMGKNNASPTDLHNEEAITPQENGKGFIGTVKDGSGWHVSLLYTAAENLRGNNPMPATSIAAKGAATPEAAVEEMVRAGLAADVKRVIELVDPKEGAALHDYGQILVDKVADVDVDTTGWPKLETLELTSAPSDFGTVVVVKKIVISTDRDGFPQKFTVVQDGNCAEITTDDDGDITTKKMCSSDVQEVMSGGLQECDDDDLECAQTNVGFDVMQTIMGRAQANPYKSGLIAHQIDGKWYVAPLSTMADAMFRLAALVERSDIEKLTK